MTAPERRPAEPRVTDEDVERFEAMMNRVVAGEGYSRRVRRVLEDFASRSVPADAVRRPCIWTAIDDGPYETECGHLWEFNDGTPAENKAYFCMYCGGELVDHLAFPADAPSLAPVAVPPGDETRDVLRAQVGTLREALGETQELLREPCAPMDRMRARRTVAAALTATAPGEPPGRAPSEREGGGNG